LHPHTVAAYIRPGEQSGFIAECPDLGAVTHAATLDDVVANSNEAVALALEGEDLEAMGLAPTLVISLSLQLA
jgi:predicted RNase H-like HicB family nuclease